MFTRSHAPKSCYNYLNFFKPKQYFRNYRKLTSCFKDFGYFDDVNKRVFLFLEENNHVCGHDLTRGPSSCELDALRFRALNSASFLCLLKLELAVSSSRLRPSTDIHFQWKALLKKI